MEAIVERALAAGYTPGKTPREEVRTYSGFSPRLLVSGGRTRFALPGRPERFTLGKRTVCLYQHNDSRKVPVTQTVWNGSVRTYQGAATEDMTCLDTLDVPAVIAELERRAAPLPPIDANLCVAGAEGA